MINIGVLGAGHLGKIHMRLLKESSKFNLVGFFEPQPELASTVSKEFGVNSYASIEELLEKVDVVDVVTPTLSHFQCAKQALIKGKHVFIEKPVTNTLEEASELMQLAEENNLKVQVGHVERFNPAFIASLPYINKPMFIEAHRLSLFNPRGTDVPVVLDLMIHDIDAILSIVKSPVKTISASGVKVISKTPDIANARIEFENGCVANLTASRISMKNMRKSRVFQRDAYIAIDFLEKKSEIVKMKDVEGQPDPFAMIIDVDNHSNKKQIYFEQPVVEPNNAIKEELEKFADSINNNTEPIVTLSDGYNALEVALTIVEKFNLNEHAKM